MVEVLQLGDVNHHAVNMEQVAILIVGAAAMILDMANLAIGADDTKSTVVFRFACNRFVQGGAGLGLVVRVDQLKKMNRVRADKPLGRVPGQGLGAGAQEMRFPVGIGRGAVDQSGNPFDQPVLFRRLQ